MTWKMLHFCPKTQVSTLLNSRDFIFRYVVDRLIPNHWNLQLIESANCAILMKFIIWLLISKLALKFVTHHLLSGGVFQPAWLDNVLKLFLKMNSFYSICKYTNSLFNTIYGSGEKIIFTEVMLTKFITLT